MKIFFVLLITLLCINSVNAQKQQSPFESLYAKFVDTYQKIGAENPSQNYVEWIYRTMPILFSSFNSDYLSSIEAFKKSKKIDTETACRIITDSVITKFLKKDIWSDKETAYLVKHEKVMQYVNQKSCDCITEKAGKKFALAEQFLTIMEECGKKLMFDTAYSATVRKLAGNITLNELAEISNVGGKYMFLHCPVASDYLWGNVKMNAAVESLYEIEHLPHTYGMRSLEAYEKGDKKELVKLFPGYAKFANDLNAAVKFNKKKQTSTEDEKKNADGSLTITTTYFKIDEKTDAIQLLSQIIYTASSMEPSAKIVSFYFLTPDKIKDKKNVLAKLKMVEMIEEPPPEIIDVKEYRIDTLQKKN